MTIIKETCTKGTNIYLGNDKRDYINKCVEILRAEGFTEIQIPILQEVTLFKDKVGKENNNLMYTFTDRGGRELCLAPEYTAVVMNLKDTFKYQNDVKLFYVAECFRGEKPQAGRYRQFTQLGVEIINPTQQYDLSNLALKLLCSPFNWSGAMFLINKDVQRGLDYYKDGQGFEIRYKEHQIVGGGEYEGGVGFALGVDRLLNVTL